MQLDNLNPGDLLFFWGNDFQSRCISLATWGPCHVGIITKYNDQLLLAESTANCTHPCVIQNKIVYGVQFHYVDQRISDYSGGKVQIYHMVNECTLSEDKIVILNKILMSYVGVAYDMNSAVLSAAPFIKMLPYPDESSLFCSALVARIYQILNRMNWSNPEIYSPAGLRRSLLWSAVIKPGRIYYP